MDAFEQIIEGLFQELGYWTRIGYKINLTKAEKVEIDKPSTPRPEIDILAYKPKQNELLWIECKSFLDSTGVQTRSFDKADGAGAQRYKIFTNDHYRDVLSRCLLNQVIEEGLAIPTPSLHFCLVAGRVYPKGRTELTKHFEANGWILYDDLWIMEQLKKLSSHAYENNVAMIVSKLFERARKSDAN